MLNRKIAIITIIFSALIVGLGVSFAFGNTINPDCPDEVKQAIQNWDKGLDERDAKNNVVAPSYGANKKASQGDAATNLRTLFLTSLITLTFNTPVHSQIIVSNAIQKLFTVAKQYLRLPSTLCPLPSLVAVFTALKRYFEKIFLLFLGLILPAICFLVVSYLPLTTYHLPLFYQFHNLRL